MAIATGNGHSEESVLRSIAQGMAAQTGLDPEAIYEKLAAISLKNLSGASIEL
ncbi:hypothetical protein [Xanthomonas phage JGB6]|nr:hypothetical protein [Xanthomonas phage JGB6]